MHQNPHAKRRKKRIFQGTKTVTVVRGKVGYGFTISGQNPCMLSSIVPGSPAEAAGLKPGDLLYIVNGLNVSKACHDDVVRMVGLSTGSLELQVGENHNSSDSSDDDYPPRCKSRYPNRVRPRHASDKNTKYEKMSMGRQQQAKQSAFPTQVVSVEPESDLSSSFTSQDDQAWYAPANRQHHVRESSYDSRKESSNYDSLERDKFYHMPPHSDPPVMSTAKRISSSAAVVKKVPQVRGAAVRQHSHQSSESASQRNSISSDSGGSLKASSKGPPRNSSIDEEEEQMPKVAESVRAVVGYIGSIETPSSHTRPHQRLQALRNAVRRLRVEKRVHTLVLMEVNSVGVVLTNAMGKQLALYPSERIAFSGICPDDERFFGLVTLSFDEDDTNSVYGAEGGHGAPHSSCHIFMIEPELSPHSAHSLQAEVFQINCTKNPETRRCDEFPRSATSLILCIANLYRNSAPHKFDSVTEIVRSQALADPSRAIGERNLSSCNNSASSINNLTNNSTSDSGLGFTKEEAPLEQNEQVCIVDLPASKSLEHNNSSDMSVVAMDTSVLSQEIDVESTPTAPHSAQRHLSAFDLRRAINTSTSSEECWLQTNRPIINNRLTPRAMPDPRCPRSKSSENLLDKFTKYGATASSVSPENTESLRQSMQRLLQARHRHLYEQNMQLGSDGESVVGDTPVVSLSVTEDGTTVLEAAGGGRSGAVTSTIGDGFMGMRQCGAVSDNFTDIRSTRDNPPGAATIKDDSTDMRGLRYNPSSGSIDQNPGVFAIPTNPPPKSVHGHSGSGMRSHDGLTVRSAFQVPRPVSAPLVKQRSSSHLGTTDAEKMQKLSPRAFPNASPSTGSVFRSPSAPPAPFFPHRDSDSDDDDDEDMDQESEDDPYIRQILQRFSIDRKAAVDDESRRFSESFALTQKRDKERQQELKAGWHPSQKWTKAGSFRRGPHAAPVGPASLKQSFSQSHESLAVGDDPASANNVKLLAACSVNNIAAQTNSSNSSRANHGQNKAGRVASWAVNFQNLLSDHVGIEIFTEFLQKEFSEENIIFWKACEQYRQLKDDQQRRHQANDIYTRYLSSKADEPVNVDSAARSHTEQFLDSPTDVMFDMAQQQIFQLMRQDSYSRFLKSDLYKTRMMDEMAGKPLEHPASGANTVAEDKGDGGQGNDKKKGKGKENEDKRRRSILPWRNGRKSVKGESESKKSKQKVKEEKEKEQKEQQLQQQQQQHTNGLNNNNINNNNLNTSGTSNEHSSTIVNASSSGANLKKAPGPGIDLSTMRKEVFHPKDSKDTHDGQFKFCRIVMPDGSTTVVCAKPGQSTRYVLGKLCEKRSISLASVDVFLLGSDRLLDLNEDISNLGSKEIVIELRVMFRLDMPSGKSIGVKAKPNRSIRDVFKPILQKYGYSVDSVAVRLVTSHEFLDLDVAVSELDKQRAVVVPTNTDVADWVRRGGMPGPDPPPPPTIPTLGSSAWRGGGGGAGGSLEEVTNKIFEDLMRGKSQLAHGFDELGVLELDKTKGHKNEEGRSLGLFGLLRKESLGAKDNKNSKTKGKVTFALPRNDTKKKASAKEGERLFELLSSAQSLRLEEQRGTHISPGDLPSFLCEDAEKQDGQHTQDKSNQKQEELFDDVNEISRASQLDKRQMWATRESDVSASVVPTPRQPSGAPTPRLSTSTPRGSKYGVRAMPVTPLPQHSDQSFSGDGVYPTPGQGTAYFRMSPIIVDSQPSHLGKSLDAALELRSSDKYPDTNDPSSDEPYTPVQSSSSSGFHTFHPSTHSTQHKKEKAPVASPEKFSPEKKKQRNSPQNGFEKIESQDSVPRSAISPSFFFPDRNNSAPVNPSTHTHQYFTDPVYSHSPRNTLSPSHTRSPSPHKSTLPRTSHHYSLSRGMPASPGKNNRLSDGMLLRKLQQAQKERESLEYATHSVSKSSSMFRRTPSPADKFNFPSDQQENLSQRALLSPRLGSARTSWQPGFGSPTFNSRSVSQQRVLLSPRFDMNIQPSSSGVDYGLDKREPPPYKRRQSPVTAGVGVDAMLSPRYSPNSFSKQDNLSMPSTVSQESATALLSPRYSPSSFPASAPISSSYKGSPQGVTSFSMRYSTGSPLKETNNSHGVKAALMANQTISSSRPLANFSSSRQHTVLSQSEGTVTFV